MTQTIEKVDIETLQSTMHANKQVFEQFNPPQPDINTTEIKRKDCDNVPMRKKKRQKEFKLEESYITNEYKHNKGFRSFCNTAIVFVVLWLVGMMLGDYLNNKPFVLPGMATFLQKFEGFLYLWYWHFGLTFSSLVVPVGFRIWVNSRPRHESFNQKAVDSFALTLLILFLLAFLVVPIWYLVKTDLGGLTVTTISLDQVRIMMKMIAFLVNKIKEVLDKEQETENDDTKISSTVAKFIYFVYAPTLIYSDTYPRTDKIRFSVMLLNFILFFFVLYLICAILERHFVPTLVEYIQNSTPKNILNIFLLIVSQMIPAYVMVCLFINNALNPLQDFFAELLRFGDRRYHADWWNACTLSTYFRKENIIVQDWLHYCISIPVTELTGSRITATLCVLIVSAIGHEIVLTLAVGFFIPINFILYFVGGAVVIILERGEGTLQYMLLLVQLMLVVSTVMTSLGLEALARQYCARTIDSGWDYVTPRILNCKLE